MTDKKQRREISSLAIILPSSFSKGHIVMDRFWFWESTSLERVSFSKINLASMLKIDFNSFPSFLPEPSDDIALDEAQ